MCIQRSSTLFTGIKSKYIKWQEKSITAMKYSQFCCIKLNGCLPTCSAGPVLTMDDNKSQIPHHLLSTKLKRAVQGAGRWNAIKSHWRRNWNSATQFVANCGKTIQMTKEPTIGVCSVWTVIRDEELTSRRSKTQPVRQIRSWDGFTEKQMKLHRRLPRY